MKKNGIRVISILVAVILVALSAPATISAQEQNTKYPCVFVHGMLGWGDYDATYDEMPYWGYNTENGGDILESLREQGYTCVAPSMGGLSSAWDRSCELYAQLTGTVVDYGQAHSAAHRHDRYGRSYEGRGLLDTFGKTDENGDIIKINLLGHSFGGPTIRLFASLLAYGAQEETDATGAETSPLFTGGKADWVNCVVTLSSPTNGTPLGSVVVDKLPIVLYVFSLIANIGGMQGEESFTDYQLDHFGLTADKVTGEKPSFNICNIINFASAKDNCGEDMAIDTAAQMLEKYPDNQECYYLSYTGCGTQENSLGNQVPTDEISSMFGIFCTYVGFSGGRTFGGVKLGEEWEANDGLVPVYSARCPIGAKSVDVTEDTVISEKGTWYVMPVINGVDHSYFMGLGMENPTETYTQMIELMNSLG